MFARPRTADRPSSAGRTRGGGRDDVSSSWNAGINGVSLSDNNHHHLLHESSLYNQSHQRRPSSAPRGGRAETVEYVGSPLSRASSTAVSPDHHRRQNIGTAKFQQPYQPVTPNIANLRPSSRSNLDDMPLDMGSSIRRSSLLQRPQSARSNRGEPLRASATFGEPGTQRPKSARAATNRDIFANDTSRPMTAGGGYVGYSGERPQRQSPAPPKAGAFKVRTDLMKPSLLKKFYDRGDLPISVDHRPNENLIKWKVDIAKLDYHYYLPIFFDGLRETSEPYAMFSRRGILDMLEHGPGRVVAVLPQLIVPIKDALNTRQPEIVERTLKILQAMVQCDERVGECLVPYYRQLLPIFNLLKSRNKNIGDNIDYGQRGRNNVGELINETLEMFEMYGGHDAFINIKYMVPTYESVMVT